MEQISHHPMLGVSASQAYAELADLRQGEGIVDFVNAYIWYGMIAGVGGIFLLLCSFYAPAIKLLEIRKRLSAVPELIPIGALVFSVVLFTSVTAFTSGFGSMSYFIFYVILAIGSALASRPRGPVTTPQRETTPELAASVGA
jgi:O-antigen ligase